MYQLLTKRSVLIDNNENDNDIDGNKVDLLKFFHWLDERLSEAHNPIVLIINAEEKQKKEQEKSSSKHKDFNRTHALREDNKDDKTDRENFNIICWLCTGNHKISNCQKLKNESIENRRSLKKKKKLCFNCLSNTHMINTCKSKMHCQVDNCQKTRHTLDSPDQIDGNVQIAQIKLTATLSILLKRKYCLKHVCKSFL